MRGFFAISYLSNSSFSCFQVNIINIEFRRQGIGATGNSEINRLGGKQLRKKLLFLEVMEGTYL